MSLFPRWLACLHPAGMWVCPVGAGLTATAVYTFLAVAFGPRGLEQSAHPYFVYLAEAFLRGQLALAQTPPNTPDLSLYEGRYYLYWPPFPAVLFMPLVALFGTGISDAPLTLAFGGLNVALVATLLRELDRHGVAPLTVEKRVWLTAFFAFGTVHVAVAPYARVWFTAQVVGFGLLCGAYLAAVRLPRRWAPLVSGALVACAFLTRSAMLLASLWIAWYLWARRDRGDRWSTVRMAAFWLAPIVLAIGLLGGYNYLRFGDPLDMGLAYHQMGAQLRSDYDRHGAFSLHYLPTNLYYNFVAIPYLAMLGDNWKVDFFMGGSLFLLSPVFLLAIPGVVRSWRAHGWALAASFLVGLVPILLLMGTGWMEFGPRYTLDVTVPLLVATAIGAGSASRRLLLQLAMVSFAMYLPGTMLLGLSWGRP